VITSLAGDLLRSYRQLPVNLYQIQTKFRDEIRPRFGLMRGREFIMKDAYSFHATEESLQDSYAAMDEAYRRIFARCGLDAVPVDADSGAIGGAASQEFMVTADAGEDLILTSDDGLYAANQEKAISCPDDAAPLDVGEPATVETPGQGSIESLCKAQGWHPSRIIKVLLLLARMEDGSEQPLLVSLRGDQELNEVKLSNVLTRLLEQGVLGCHPITDEETGRQGLDPLPLGAIGPDLDDAWLEGARSWTTTFVRLADITATELDRFHCGGNSPDQHRCHCNWESLGGRHEGHDCARPVPERPVFTTERPVCRRDGALRSATFFSWDGSTRKRWTAASPTRTVAMKFLDGLLRHRDLATRAGCCRTAPR